MATENSALVWRAIDFIGMLDAAPDNDIADFHIEILKLVIGNDGRKPVGIVRAQLTILQIVQEEMTERGLVIDQESDT